MEKKIDPFGFQGQSEDYDLERPRYPPSFISEILLHTNSKENYIDIATGTGILFFEIAQKFHGVLAVNDRSAKQLKVFKEKLENSGLDRTRVKSIESDSYKIHELLPQSTRFNLITIAQGFHWFDPDKFCQYTKSHLLDENGTFAVLGYFCDGCDFNLPKNLGINTQGQKHYDKWYSTVFPYFDCDRSSLDQGHQNFEFGKYFENTKFIEDQTRVEISLERFTGFLGTSSAYNIYRDKFQKDPQYEDPIQTFTKNIKEELNSYSQTYNLPTIEKPLIMKTHFFLWILKNGKKLIK